MAQPSLLITGASSGFGAGVALEMARKGWRVFASMRDPDKAGDLLASATAQDVGQNIEIVQLDVTDEASVRAAISEVESSIGGPIDALLSNAGYGAIGFFEDLPEAECRRQFETNFFGALAVARAVIPKMRSARKGRIVIVTSNALNAPHPALSMYAASKWALEGWAEGLAMELEPFGIDVSVAEPGNHKTPFGNNTAAYRPADSPYERLWLAAEDDVGKLGQMGADPAKAISALVNALTTKSPIFRYRIGRDTILFSALKGVLPYRARTWLFRRFVNLPRTI